MRRALSRVIETFSLSPRDVDDASSRANGNGIAEDFMPDDELVRRELAASGGYMWQGSIAAEIGWSSPKTSRVLSKMERDDRICRRQIGRRKIVSLPEQAPWFTEPAEEAYRDRGRAIVGETQND